jgi:hypothetical protein
MIGATVGVVMEAMMRVMTTSSGRHTLTDKLLRSRFRDITSVVICVFSICSDH